MFRALLIFSIVFLQGCLLSQNVNIKGKEGAEFNQVSFSELPRWDDADHKKAIQAFIHSCNKFSKMAQNRVIGRQIVKITASDFYDVCEIAQVVKTMNSNQAQNFFENWFRPFLVSNKRGNSRGVFTGYYEASLNASEVKTEKFKYPIYAKPTDLTKEPYLTRAEIEEGALKNKGLELVYTDDKVDLFFMHIQGSGRATMPNGDEVRIAYAGRNNRKFIAIANYMADQGYLSRSNLNAATIKDWLRNNPDKADEVMNINEAFTFFRISKNEYIIGGQGVPLTPEHSLAVDRKVIPYGIPLWVDTKLKKKDGSKEQYSHLLIAQDTGSAIKGAVRGDIFFGHGIKNEEKAYYMASQGEYYALLPISIVDKMRNHRRSF